MGSVATKLSLGLLGLTCQGFAQANPPADPVWKLVAEQSYDGVCDLTQTQLVVYTCSGTDAKGYSVNSSGGFTYIYSQD